MQEAPCAQTGNNDGDPIGTSLRPPSSLPSSATCSPPSSPGQHNTHSRLAWSQQWGKGQANSNLPKPREACFQDSGAGGGVLTGVAPILIDHRALHTNFISAAEPASSVCAEFQGVADEHAAGLEHGFAGVHDACIVVGGCADISEPPFQNAYCLPLAPSGEASECHSSDSCVSLQLPAWPSRQPLTPLPPGSAAAPLRSLQDMTPLLGPHARNAPQLDGEVVQYARMLSQQAKQAGTFDQKVTALSRRVASELRKAEREREDHAKRLEVLEVFRMQQISVAEEQLCQVHDVAASEVERVTQKLRCRLDRDLTQMSEQLEYIRMEARDARDIISSKLQIVSKRIDAEHEGLDALRAYRKEAESAMAKSQEDSSIAMDALAAARRSAVDVTDQLEERLETAITRERKQGHERLRSSCAELTGYLNRLRSELVQQQSEVKNVGSQISDLGTELGSRLQAKIAATTQTLSDQANAVRIELQAALDVMKERVATSEVSLEQLGGYVQTWRQDVAEIHSSTVDFRELVRRECERAIEIAQGDAHTVHLEVMSINTRMAAVEEYLAARRNDFSRNGPRKHNALLFLQGARGESLASTANCQLKSLHNERNACYSEKFNQATGKDGGKATGDGIGIPISPLLSPASESRALQRAVDNWDFPSPPCSPGSPGSPKGLRGSYR